MLVKVAIKISISPYLKQTWSQLLKLLLTKKRDRGISEHSNKPSSRKSLNKCLWLLNVKNIKSYLHMSFCFKNSRRFEQATCFTLLLKSEEFIQKLMQKLSKIYIIRYYIIYTLNSQQYWMNAWKCLLMVTLENRSFLFFNCKCW